MKKKHQMQLCVCLFVCVCVCVSHPPEEPAQRDAALSRRPQLLQQQVQTLHIDPVLQQLRAQLTEQVGRPLPAAGVYTHVHARTHARTHTNTHTHTRTHARMQKHTYARIHHAFNVHLYRTQVFTEVSCFLIVSGFLLRQRWNKKNVTGSHLADTCPQRPGLDQLIGKRLRPLMGRKHE